ncbi:MAG: hypothetical protein JO264_21075 [Acidisphaera sp.]|nr:hypothetical protein [Acidisphaera sp.]
MRSILLLISALLLPATALAYTADFSCTGISDDTVTVQSAITAAGSGILSFPVGKCNFSSTLTLPAGQRWRGQGKNITTLFWIGGSSTDLVATTSLGTYGGIEDMTIDAGTSASGLTLIHIKDAAFGTYRNLLLNGNNGSGNICLYLQAGVSGSGSNYNAALNSFYDIRGNECQTGFQFNGTSTSFATDNNFYNIDVEGPTSAAGTCLNAINWADTNNFY